MPLKNNVYILGILVLLYWVYWALLHISLGVFFSFVLALRYWLIILKLYWCFQFFLFFSFSSLKYFLNLQIAVFSRRQS